MKKIKMVDLRAQHRPVRGKIRRKIRRVIKSANFIQGPEVALFERNLQNYLQVKHVIGCACGTDALQIALMALDLQRDDEVIIPAFTFVSALEVITSLGLKPVLVDIDRETFNMEPRLVEEAVTPRTKAIIPTHLFGQCANMTEIMEIAEHYGLFVIEDACQSIGSDYILREGVGELQMGPFTYNYRCDEEGVKKKAGTIGHIGCFSFFPTKNLGCYGDGGALCTNLDDLAEKIRMIAKHGAGRKYIHTFVGLNSRLDTIQAAVLNAHLPRLRRNTVKRQKIAAIYDQYFVSCMQLRVPGRSPQSTHVFNQYCLLCRSERERNALRFHLESMGVPTTVYYPKPLHLQEAYVGLGYQEGDFPVAESVCKQIMAIPMHPKLKRRQVRYICRSILSFF